MRVSASSAILLAAIGLASCGGDAPKYPDPPWNLAGIEADMQSHFGQRLTKIRLLAWHIDLICPPKYPPGYGEHVLLAAESRGTTATSGPEWLLILASLSDRWEVDSCAHCRSPILYLDRPPRPEDLNGFVPGMFFNPEVFGDKVLAYGILEENWKETFGVEPTPMFKGRNLVPGTCDRTVDSPQ